MADDLWRDLRYLNAWWSVWRLMRPMTESWLRLLTLLFTMKTGNPGLSQVQKIKQALSIIKELILQRKMKVALLVHFDESNFFDENFRNSRLADLRNIMQWYKEIACKASKWLRWYPFTSQGSSILWLPVSSALFWSTIYC